MKKNSRLIIAVVSLLIVVACAGGGDTANDTATSDKETPNSVKSENEDTNKPSTDSVSTEEIVKEIGRAHV